MFRGAPLRVPTLMRTLLIVSLLLMKRVLENRTRLLADLQCYVPQVSFTYHLVLIFLMH